VVRAGSAWLGSPVRRCCKAVDRIEEAPLSFPLVVRLDADLGVRRALLHRFPYSVVFLPLATELRVLAIAHLHRRPGYWRRRAPL
jgi:hypothetical protein